MLRNSSINANRHSARRGGLRAIKRRLNPTIHQHGKHAQRLLLRTGLNFLSSLEITCDHPYEVQDPSRHQPVLLQHLIVHSIVLI
jgi:hypothetical protein